MQKCTTPFGVQVVSATVLFLGFSKNLPSKFTENHAVDKGMAVIMQLTLIVLSYAAKTSPLPQNSVVSNRLHACGVFEREAEAY